MILFDQGPGGQATLFQAPERLILAHGPEQVAAALAAMSQARASGLWLAGYASYELGYALEPRLARLIPEGRRVPLLAFGAYRAPQDGATLLAQAEAEARVARPRLSALVPDWGRDAYGLAFDRVKAFIAAGDCYQVNLTMPLRGQAEGSALALYGALIGRQAVRHGALVDLGVGPVILSRSPELFFRTSADGLIEAHPMKGTTPRDPDPARDAAQRARLQASLKDRAENLMIVDLLRNDLSRLCAVGSVRVPELYRVETYATVHQMVSRIRGRLLPGLGIAQLIGALFPCGSITGAPKIRAMEIIRAVEPLPRDAYCGAIGWFAPDGSAEFNVAIRSLTLHPGGEVVMNVGGGVVQDSTAAAEYEEALWKARFANLG